MKLIRLFVISLLLVGGRAIAEDTVIKGASMELLDQGERVVFSGGVRMVRGTDTLQAQRMETTKRRDRVTAIGNVRLFRQMNEQEKINGFGKKGFYDTETGDAYLLGSKEPSHVIFSQVLSATATRVIDVYADRFDFSETHSTGVARGNVYGKSVDPNTNDLYEFWAEQAQYDAKAKTIILTGKNQPRVHQKLLKGARTIDGNVITYFYEAKKFISDGNARAVFEDPKRKRS